MKLLQIDGDGRIVAEYDSPTDAAEATGLDSSHIIKVLKGKRSTHGGYRWKYEDGYTESDDEVLEKKTADYKEDSAVLTAKTEKSIRSLEEAIKYFEIDTNKWEVERFVVNSWDVTSSKGKKTNYQVKVFLKQRQKTLDEVFIDVFEILKDYTPKVIEHTIHSNGTISVELSDFHIGAEVKNLTRTKDFNIEILADYLHTISKMVNHYHAKNVVLNMHGDFVETMTGLNHDDSWKSIGEGMHGANVLIVANELLAETLISKITNVREINIIAGNHDRISASRTIDTKGEGAKLLAWMLEKDFPDIPINYNDLILVREIDGINHIMTHGNHGISKKDVSKVVADYGNSNMFNLWTEGHTHSRLSTRVLKSRMANYETIDYVELDDMNYRKLVLPPLFTGNFYSESIGYGSWAGFLVTMNNGKGIPNVHDYTI